MLSACDPIADPVTSSDTIELPSIEVAQWTDPTRIGVYVSIVAEHDDILGAALELACDVDPEIPPARLVVRDPSDVVLVDRELRESPWMTRSAWDTRPLVELPTQGTLDARYRFELTPDPDIEWGLFLVKCFLRAEVESEIGAADIQVWWVRERDP